MSAVRAYTCSDDPTLVRMSRPLLKGLSGPPITGETRAGGSGTGRTDFERIGMDIDATQMLYPIPQSEIDVAPGLTQNPGY